MKKSERKIIDILSYLTSFINEHNYAPSYREICKAVELKSVNSVKEYLDVLEQRGFIKKQTDKSRCIEIVGKNASEMIDLPLVGQVAAGEPIFAEQNIEDFVSVSSSFFGVSKDVKGSIFMLKVVGESMIEKGINNGDYVIALTCNNADNGDLVVAMIDGNATVKTFYREMNMIRLQPANQLYTPIFSDNVQVLGKVIGLIRKY